MSRVETFAVVCAAGYIHDHEGPLVYETRQEAERAVRWRDRDTCGPHRVAHLVEAGLDAIEAEVVPT